jgi:hypothetical protein
VRTYGKANIGAKIHTYLSPKTMLITPLPFTPKEYQKVSHNKPERLEAKIKPSKENNVRR